MTVENSASPAGNEPTSAPVDPNSVGEPTGSPATVGEEPKNVVQSLADRWKKQRNERGQFQKDKAEKEAAAKAEAITEKPAVSETETENTKESDKPTDQEEKGASLRLARALVDS